MFSPHTAHGSAKLWFMSGLSPPLLSLVPAAGCLVATLPWPQEAAEICHVLGWVVASLSHRAHWGGGAGSYENLHKIFYLTCYEKTHHMRREAVTSL